MPCYTRTTITTAVSNWNQERAERVIQELRKDRKVSYYTSIFNGVLSSDNKQDITTVRKAYAAETLKTAAKRFGWSVKSEINNQIHLTRS